MGGVTEFIIGQLIVDVPFPLGFVGCLHCPYKRYRITDGVTRTICAQTYEALDNIDRLHERGQDCPLIFEERSE